MTTLKVIVTMTVLVARVTSTDTFRSSPYQLPRAVTQFGNHHNHHHDHHQRLDHHDHHQRLDHHHHHPRLDHHHHHKSHIRTARYVQQAINTTELYGSCLRFTRSFLALLRTPPDNMTLENLRPQLRSILRDMDLLAFFTARLAGHLDAVNSAGDARAIYNVLDLYSALEERRLRYLDKVRARLQALAADVPSWGGRGYNQLGHMVPAFLRHIDKIRGKASELLRSALKPKEENVDLVAFYEQGGLPKLDAFASTLSLPSPFLTLDDQRYHLRPADQPNHLLGVQPVNQLWSLVVTNNTSPFTLFSFKAIPARFGAVRYVLTCASLPATQHLIFPEGAARRPTNPYFGPQESGGGSLTVVTLPGEEHVLVHQTRHQAFFLTWTPEGHQVTVTSPYPGRPAHWLLSKARGL